MILLVLSVLLGWAGPDDFPPPKVMADALSQVGPLADPRERHVALRELLRHRDHHDQALTELIALITEEPPRPGWVDTYRMLLGEEVLSEADKRLISVRLLHAEAARSDTRQAALAGASARLKGSPQDPRLRSDLAEALLYAGHAEKALATLLDGPTDARGDTLRLHAVLASRALEDSGPLTALARDAGLPASPQVGLDASRALEDAGYLRAAERALLRRDGLPDTGPDAVRRLARLSMVNGVPERALALLDALLSVSPDDQEAKRLRSFALILRVSDVQGLPLWALLTRLGEADEDQRQVISNAVSETRRQDGDRALGRSTAEARTTWMIARLTGREPDPIRRFERALVLGLLGTREAAEQVASAGPAGIHDAIWASPH